MMNQVIKDMVVWIEDNLDKNIRLKDLEKRSGYTIWHFQRMFKRSTGITVAEYIRRRRLTLAASEIKISRRSITNIALNYNFSSVQNFCRLFKTVFNLSPTQFRKEPCIDFSKQLAPIISEQKVIFISCSKGFYTITYSQFDSKTEIAMTDANGRYILSRVKNFKQTLNNNNGETQFFLVDVSTFLNDNKGNFRLRMVKKIAISEYHSDIRKNFSYSKEETYGKYAVFKFIMYKSDIHLASKFVYTAKLPEYAYIKRAGFDIQIVSHYMAGLDFFVVEYMIPIHQNICPFNDPIGKAGKSSCPARLP
ncbi:helix-turn-helix domain-containing protein [Martelella alba]|nr:helix-turn-helix domain-containing protein [Martelella alba]